MALTEVRDVGLAQVSIVATGLLGLFGIFVGPMPDELEAQD